MTIVVVAEKPSVARDIAAVLGATKRGEGYFDGGGYVVTWAIGHLVALAQPHEINPNWKPWSMATLPMLPTRFPLIVVPETKAQFAVVRRLLRERSVDRVVCATDAGREGELIFRYIYEAAACKKPVSRLWISSLTPDAIRNGFERLRDATEFERLADAAKGRSRADWLVGMNLSRAYSLSLDQEISVGRVQTPTLGMVVEREIAIRNFVAEDYLEVVATFLPSDSSTKKASDAYHGTWFRTLPVSKNVIVDPAQRRRLPPDGAEAEAIVARARSGKAAIESLQAEVRRLPPPLLYDLTELQRHANRLFGMTAQQTLSVAQSLYERHKLLSYPRTDSRHLSQDIAKTLGAVVATIGHRYPSCLANETGERPLGRRFVDDSRVTDHHAIIPTSIQARDAALSTDERRLYDLVCRRLLQAWHDDHVYSTTTVITAITSHERVPLVDRYESRGTAVEQIGWKVLDLGGGRKAPKAAARSSVENRGETEDPNDDADQALPSGLLKNQRQIVLDAKAEPKRTRPPKRYTEATLLTAMESAGRTLDEKELEDAMRDLGLGTPATRAQIIETLLRREYVVRRGKTLEATDKGIGLIAVVHPEAKSPAMTGEWEAKLKRLQRGEGDLGEFMHGIENYVREVVERVRLGHGLPTQQNPPCAQDSTANSPQKVVPRASEGFIASTAVSAGVKKPQPTSMPSARNNAHQLAQVRLAPRVVTQPEDLRGLLQSSFGFSEFRPHQETVCHAAAAGQDLLLVMPTGAGKSLCYQLPGVARGGTTLVISPLIALMEDQATKLNAQGFRAERIHSGRSRAESRQVCVDYLAGNLDFLFIAPERLRVAGFPELLAKRVPSLIAVDEAHCISQWGHDFRPDYRLLGQRLPLLRPAPIIALTATATPQVQDDIVLQLGLEQPKRFIHGFRRTNIAIEVVELNPGARAKAVRALLADRSRRPAIVYAATRKSAEQLGAALGKKLAAVYHAGMDAADRDQVQAAFLDGRQEVIVATVAFGMGIDKANVRTIIHAALPGSLEGYYQEIGRAGRDGQNASAILLHSFVDRKTHEFFHDRDYPSVQTLEGIYDKLTNKPLTREKLLRKVRLKAESFDRALEKLALHGGAKANEDGEYILGNATWKQKYLVQTDHKLAQLASMARFTESQTCRMVNLVRHFGDQKDSGSACGICDICAPTHAVAGQFRKPSDSDNTAAARILATLARTDGQATGKLHREAFSDGSLDRRSFEHVLRSLCQAGMISVSTETFEKNGKAVTYHRAELTLEGRRRGAASAAVTLGPVPVPKRRGRATKARPAKKAKAKAKIKRFVAGRTKRATKPAN